MKKKYGQVKLTVDDMLVARSLKPYQPLAKLAKLTLLGSDVRLNTKVPLELLHVYT